MTKEEYQDFVLRYKGCGACFPNYYTLSQEEKLWFSAIQKDVTELEKKNAELKEKLKPENCLKLLAKDGYIKFTSEQLPKATEIIRGLYFIVQSRIDYENNTGIADEMWRARQFLWG